MGIPAWPACCASSPDRPQLVCEGASNATDVAQPLATSSALFQNVVTNFFFEHENDAYCLKKKLIAAISQAMSQTYNSRLASD